MNCYAEHTQSTIGNYKPWARIGGGKLFQHLLAAYLKEPRNAAVLKLGVTSIYEEARVLCLFCEWFSDLEIMVWDEVKQCFVLSDAVCLVTGGAAGVGAALVSSLLTENAQHVAFLDIEEKKGAALETQLNAKFGALRAKFIKCDIANEDELTRAYKLVTDKYRRLDVVVNNAAVLSRDGENSGRMVDVNFKASVNSTFKAVEAMSAENGGSGGVVVNISSLLALNQDSRLAVYSATKAAVLQFTVTLGKEPFYTNSKVRLLTVCPGPTDTAIYHRQNLQNHPAHLTQPSSQKQSVESAVVGIIEVIKTGASGSVWKVADDEPAQDISQHVNKGFTVFSSVVKK